MNERTLFSNGCKSGMWIHLSFSQSNKRKGVKNIYPMSLLPFSTPHIQTMPTPTKKKNHVAWGTCSPPSPFFFQPPATPLAIYLYFTYFAELDRQCEKITHTHDLKSLLETEEEREEPSETSLHFVVFLVQYNTLHIS